MPPTAADELEGAVTALPAGPAELTAGWLAAALAEAGHGSVVVADVDVVAVGTGQTGAAYRLTVTYDGPVPDGLPGTFVAKLPSQDPEVRDRVTIGARAEVAFYRDVAESVAVPLPRCWYAGIADEGASFVLLMSDAAPARQGDQLAGCSVDAARAAVVALAGLHGPRWCDPTWHDQEGVAMPRPDAAGAQGMAEVARMATDLTLAGLGDRLSEQDRATLDAFPDHVAGWLLAEHDRFGLLHGDYRLDNLLFSPDGTEVTVVDWQTLAVGLPARDLAYFVATTFDPDERRAVERDLVAAYHQALVAHGVTGYDLDQAWTDYALGTLQAPLITVLGFAFAATTERGADMFVAMLSRSLPAIRDLGAYELVQAAGG